MDHPNTAFIPPLICCPVKDVLQFAPPPHNLEHNKNIWTFVASVNTILLSYVKSLFLHRALRIGVRRKIVNRSIIACNFSAVLQVCFCSTASCLKGRPVPQVLPINAYYNRTLY